MSSDALCLTSIYEGLPLVILEAMSVGVPVLSTPVGGIPETIKDGRHGYLSENISIDSYIKILKKFIKNNPFDSNIIKNYYQKYYSMHACCMNYYELYNQLINEKK